MKIGSFGSTAALALGIAFGAPAQEPSTCPMTDDQQSCVRILACIGKQGQWFDGRAFWRGQGTLAGVINSGEVCTGNWTSRNRLGFGQADVSCSDGMEVSVIYTYQDEYTGTAIGRGLANNGKWVKGWSGEHVLRYLKEENGTDLPTLLCGDVEIPMS